IRPVSHGYPRVSYAARRSRPGNLLSSSPSTPRKGWRALSSTISCPSSMSTSRTIRDGTSTWRAMRSSRRRPAPRTRPCRGNRSWRSTRSPRCTATCRLLRRGQGHHVAVAGSAREQLLDVAGGLTDALRVLDEGEADVLVAILAEANPGRYGDARLLDQELCELEGPEVRELV